MRATEADYHHCLTAAVAEAVLSESSLIVAGRIEKKQKHFYNVIINIEYC